MSILPPYAKKEKTTKKAKKAKKAKAKTERSPRFSYVKYDEKSVKLQNLFRDKVEELEALAGENFPAGRAKALFMTKLEEAYMWTGKCIRDMQNHRLGKIVEEETRGE